MRSTQDFAEFAAAVSPRLRRMAFLLCGDWHTAEDLVQTTLAKVFVSWRKIRRKDAEQAYAFRTLVNTYLAYKRLKRSEEILTSRVPERTVWLPPPETRIVVLNALATLPPKSRAVVVLRYWADLSVDEVAAILGCSPGNVKSQSARALSKLRPMLDDIATESGSPGQSLKDSPSHSLEERHEAGISGMDEASLRRLLDRAVAQEPPMGPVLQGSLVAGIRLRRRRRARNAAASLATVAVIGAAIPAIMTTTLGHGSAGSPAASHKVVVYIGSDYADTVTPVSAATNTPGHPIKTDPGPRRLAITPDGKTLYAANVDWHTVTPISTATNTPGKPITVGKAPDAIAITPDGRTVYVASVISNTVTPISTATNTAGKPIRSGDRPVAIDITWDGKTAYVLEGFWGSWGAVLPINTATNTPEKPIKVGSGPGAMAIAPDGRTLYVTGGGPGRVTPISTATNTAEKPIKLGHQPVDIAVTPDGKTLYVLVNGFKGAGLVIPIATTSDQVGKPIRLPGRLPQAIAITPDGKTLYVTNYQSGTVVPISTATNTPEKLIKVGKGPVAVAFTPDGKTAYVVSLGASTVTPISTATNTPGRPIKVGAHPFAIAITP